MRDYSNHLRRFHGSYDKVASGCWIWNRAIQVRGYGIFCVNRKMVQAHRYALALRLGRSIAEGMLACHTCHNRLCVNPDHLYEGTAKDNIRDNWKVGSAYHAQGSKNGRAKLNEEDVKVIRFLLENKTPTSFIRNEFSISAPALSAIKHRTNWKHVQ